MDGGIGGFLGTGLGAAWGGAGAWMDVIFVRCGVGFWFGVWVCLFLELGGVNGEGEREGGRK